MKKKTYNNYITVQFSYLVFKYIERTSESNSSKFDLLMSNCMGNNLKHLKAILKFNHPIRNHVATTEIQSSKTMSIFSIVKNKDSMRKLMHILSWQV